jgi:DNA-binding protein H-NS
MRDTKITMRAKWPKEKTVAINLEGMSVSDLVALKSEVEAAIIKKGEADRTATLEKIKALAAESGYSLEELLKPSRTPRSSAVTTEKADKRSSVEAKFAHSENASVTWTGRGKAPKWVTEWEASGKSRDGLLIERN